MAAAYDNGTSGDGATLTASGNGVLAIDGQNPSVGDRVLVKNQTTANQNGIAVIGFRYHTLTIAKGTSTIFEEFNLLFTA